MTYTGHPIVKSIQSTNLVEGEHYVVSYSDNVYATSTDSKTVITITGISAYAGSILTYEFEITKASPNVSFANSDLKMYIEDSAFINPVIAPDYISGMIYSSSDSGIAEVDPSTGAITMNGTGTVTITVDIPESSNYTAGQATYELTVSDTPVEIVENVVYVPVGGGGGGTVTPPGGGDLDDDVHEDVIIQKDNSLNLVLLLLLILLCIVMVAYILYSRRKDQAQ